MKSHSAIYLAALFIGVTNTHAAENSATFTEINTAGNEVSLTWEGGFAPFQAQSSTSLVSTTWNDLGDPTFKRSTIALLPEDTTLFFQVLGSEAATPSARYRVTFNATWSATTHPTNFPSGNPHFSGLIGGTHNDNVTFWQPGTLASSGIESMAETGSKGGLTTEVNAAINAGTAATLLSGGGIGFSPGAVSLEFNISQPHPLVSLTSMIAPSPDWFVGVHDLNLFQNGDWIGEIIIPLHPYDSGTDDGTTYTSGNADTSPKEPIQRITGFPLAVDGHVAPLGTLTFTRIAAP